MYDTSIYLKLLNHWNDLLHRMWYTHAFHGHTYIYLTYSVTDTKGPEIRTGTVDPALGGKLKLVKGQFIEVRLPVCRYCRHLTSVLLYVGGHGLLQAVHPDLPGLLLQVSAQVRLRGQQDPRR